MEVNIAERFLDEFMADDGGEREMQRLLWTYGFEANGSYISY